MRHICILSFSSDMASFYCENLAYKIAILFYIHLFCHTLGIKWKCFVHGISKVNISLENEKEWSETA